MGVMRRLVGLASGSGFLRQGITRPSRVALGWRFASSSLPRALNRQKPTAFAAPSEVDEHRFNTQ